MHCFQLPLPPCAPRSSRSFSFACVSSGHMPSALVTLRAQSSPAGKPSIQAPITHLLDFRQNLTAYDIEQWVSAHLAADSLEAIATDLCPTHKVRERAISGETLELPFMETVFDEKDKNVDFYRKAIAEVYSPPNAPNLVRTLRGGCYHLSL